MMLYKDGVCEISSATPASEYDTCSHIAAPIPNAPSTPARREYKSELRVITAKSCPGLATITEAMKITVPIS